MDPQGNDLSLEEKLALMEAKYPYLVDKGKPDDEPAPAPEPEPEPEPYFVERSSWSADFTPISYGDGWDAAHALFDFLDSLPGIGFYPVTIDGEPSLHFRPGLDINDKQRWQLAEQAVQLLTNAAEDLRELIAVKAIILPVRKQLEGRSPQILFDT